VLAAVCWWTKPDDFLPLEIVREHPFVGVHPVGPKRRPLLVAAELFVEAHQTLTPCADIFGVVLSDGERAVWRQLLCLCQYQAPLLQRLETHQYCVAHPVCVFNQNLRSYV
jgi:hypothetical protein